MSIFSATPPVKTAAWFTDEQWDYLRKNVEMFADGSGIKNINCNVYGNVNGFVLGKVRSDNDTVTLEETVTTVLEEYEERVTSALEEYKDTLTMHNEVKVACREAREKCVKAQQVYMDAVMAKVKNNG